jgi:hypothetical protein
VPGRFGGFARSVTGSHTVKNEEEMGLQNSRCFFQGVLRSTGRTLGYSQGLAQIQWS